MIVYHGSNSNFKHLRIAKNLVQYHSTMENEGMGIYFSTDKSVAASYGKYIYTLEIADDSICDFTKEDTCQRYVDQLVKDVYNKFSVDITDYIQSLLDSTKERLYLGGLTISELGREIHMCLDSTEQWYVDGISDCKREKIYHYLDCYDKKHLKAYLFNYHIKGIGVLKTVDDDVVKIVDKQKTYETEAA